MELHDATPVDQWLPFVDASLDESNDAVAEQN